MIGGRLVENVWIVQAVRFDGVGVIEKVCADLPRALAMAAQRSMDPAVLCTSVIGCVLDQSEGRSSVAHYVDGRGQEPRAPRRTLPELGQGRTS